MRALLHTLHAMIAEIQPHRRDSPYLRIDWILRNTEGLMAEEDRWLACSETLAAVSRVNSDTVSTLRIINLDLGLAQAEFP